MRKTIIRKTYHPHLYNFPKVKANLLFIYEYEFNIAQISRRSLLKLFSPVADDDCCGKKSLNQMEEE